MRDKYFGEVDTINISNIKLPLYNFRIHNEDNIQSMADSIRQHGLLQPIIVRTTKDNNYFEVVAGYTRYLACKSLKWKKIHCHIVHLNDIQTFEMALVENIQRESFTPLEEANAFKIYISDKGWGSISELASKIEKSLSYITK
jgi:ParB family transcriptional regulator, chromosome partitioning protein